MAANLANDWPLWRVHVIYRGPVGTDDIGATIYGAWPEDWYVRAPTRARAEHGPTVLGRIQGLRILAIEVKRQRD